MARTSRSSIPASSNTTLATRTRDPLARNNIITPVAGKLIPNQADRCPFPHCMYTFPHHHSTAEGTIAPTIDEYRKAGEAIRGRWTQEQRRRIAENEALLRQLAEIEPKAGSLLIKPPLPRGNDLTAQEQIAIIHGGATLAQYEAVNEMLLEQHRQDIIDNTSPVSPVFPPGLSVQQTEGMSQSQAEQTSSLEWDDFPELDNKYGHPSVMGDSGTLELTVTSSLKSFTEPSPDGGQAKIPASSTSHKPYSLQ